MQPEQPPIDELVKIGTAAAALGVTVDTLRRWERAGRISFVRRAGQRWLSASELASLLKDRGTSAQSSARNRLPGTVVAVKKEGLIAQIEMVCGPYRIVSLISREAADELELRPGDRATAIVTSTAVIVEKR